MNDSAFSDTIRGPAGAEIMEAGVPTKTAESSRSSARTLFVGIWHWIAGFRGPVLAPSNEMPAKTAMEEILAVATPKTEVRLEGEINSAIPSALEEDEIQRRRNLVRTFFNDFWSESYEKPAGFVARLDQAEDYVNDRLAANGEAWRLDGQARVMLGLPPRASAP
jgi:hypothetical protein